MKKLLKISTAFILTFTFTAGAALAGVVKKEEATIQTSAQCETCQGKIESAVKKVKGVQTAKLDLKTKAITVSFDSGKTSVAKIREAISKTGYDADEVKADPTAYSKLHTCCKKPEGK